MATTSMQFGQSAINVVLNEGQLPAKLSTDANGNTVLLGADGNISLSRSGLRTVLFGDSMTDGYNGISGYASNTYDVTTGYLEFTYSSAHGMWTGLEVDIFHYSLDSLKLTRTLPITRVSATVIRVVLSDKPTDLPSTAVPATIHLNSRHFSQSFIHWWQLRNGNALNIVKNSGHSGDLTEVCVARLDSEVLAYNPDVVIFQCPGINDQTTTEPYAKDYNETIGWLTTIFDKLSNAVPIVIVGTITMPASGESRANLAVSRRITGINNWIKNYAKTKKNIHVFDGSSVIVDPMTGYGTAALLNATDKIHYRTKGALLVCKELEKVTSKIFPVASKTLPTNMFESHTRAAKLTLTAHQRTSNVVTATQTNHGIRVGEPVYVTGATPADANGVFICKTANTNSFTYDNAGSDTAITNAIVSSASNMFSDPMVSVTTGGYTSNGVTGVAGTAFEVSNQSGTTALVGVGSVAASVGGVGNEQLLTVTTAASGDRPSIGSRNDEFYPLKTHMVPGHSYVAEFRWRMTSTNWSLTPLSECRFDLLLNMSDGSTRFVRAFDNWDTVVESQVTTEDVDWHVKLPEIYVPDGLTVSSVYLTAYARTSAAWAGTATLVLGMSQVAVRCVE